MLALTGVVNIPIIYFSVHWWNTLHQGSSVSLTKAPAMAAIMLTGMLIMAVAAWFYAIATTLAAFDPETVRMTKSVLRRAATLQPRQALELARDTSLMMSRLA